MDLFTSTMSGQIIIFGLVFLVTFQIFVHSPKIYWVFKQKFTAYRRALESVKAKENFREWMLADYRSTLLKLVGIPATVESIIELYPKDFDLMKAIMYDCVDTGQSEIDIILTKQFAGKHYIGQLSDLKDLPSICLKMS